MKKIIDFLNSPVGKTCFRLLCVVLSMLSKNGVMHFDPVIAGIPFHDFILSGVVVPSASLSGKKQNRWL